MLENVIISLFRSNRALYKVLARQTWRVGENGLVGQIEQTESRCAILNFIQVIHHPDSKLDEWYKLRLRFLYCQIKDSRAKISSFKKSLCFKHTYCANNMNEKYFITLKWPEGEFSKKWGFPIKVDFRPNLRKAQKNFQIFVKKEGFWGSEKSLGGEGFITTLDTF